jgi:hypothetical protein
VVARRGLDITAAHNGRCVVIVIRSWAFEQTVGHIAADGRVSVGPRGRLSCEFGHGQTIWPSAPEPESSALIDGLFSPSPHRWPNQPWTAPDIPGGHVDSKLLAGRYLWFKRALAARTDSGCESSWPGRVSDGARRWNLCPQLCPVVGTGCRTGKKASRNCLLRLALRCRGDWIRTSDLLNPIFRVRGASSRRMSQMQAFWRLTDFTLRTVYADHRWKTTFSPHFPGFSVPKRAQNRTIAIYIIIHRLSDRSFAQPVQGSKFLVRDLGRGAIDFSEIVAYQFEATPSSPPGLAAPNRGSKSRLPGCR